MCKGVCGCEGVCVCEGVCGCGGAVQQMQRILGRRARVDELQEACGRVLVALQRGPEAR